MRTQLLNKNETRRYKILSLFIHNQALSISCKDIIDELNCSESTLRKELKYLNDINKSTLFKSSRGDTLVVNNNFNNVNYLREYILKTSQVSKLLKLIIVKDIPSMEEVLTTLNISESTLRRLIRKINQNLSAFDISIHPTTLEFIGSETTVRSWMAEFISQNSLTYDRARNFKMTRSLYYDLFLPLTHTNVEDLFLTPFCIQSMLLCNMFRFLSQHPIHHPEEALKHIDMKDISLSEIESILYHIDPRLLDNEATIEEILYQLLFPFLDSDFCIHHHDINDRSKSNLLTYYRQLVSAIEKNCYIHISNPEILYQNLINTHFHFTRQMFVSSYSQEIVDHFALMFPEFVEFIQTYLRQHKIVTDNFSVYTNMIINCFILYWPDIYTKLNQSTGPMKILLIPRYSLSHAQWIKKVIMMEISRHIHVDIIDQVQPDFEKVNLHQYDLVIS